MDSVHTYSCKVIAFIIICQNLTPIKFLDLYMYNELFICVIINVPWMVYSDLVQMYALPEQHGLTKIQNAPLLKRWNPC